jgi:hypothetical protein
MLLAGAAVLGLLAVWAMPRLEGANESYAPVFAVWVAACALYGGAAVVEDRRWRRWAGWRWNGRGVAALAALLGVAFGLRVWQLGSIPFTLGGDEASQGLEVLRVLRGELRNPFGTGWLDAPAMNFFYNAWSVSLLGPDVRGLRMAWAVVGTLSVLTTFLLCRRLAGTVTAWAAAVLLAVYHFHIHFSRLGSNQVADSLFASASLWLLVRGAQTGSRLSFALAGGCAGLGLYGYAGARLTAVVLAATAVWLFVRASRRTRARVGWGAVWTAGGFAVAAGPMLEFALRRPEAFNARVNQVGIFQSGWLAREVELTGESAVSLLLDQFQRAALAFHVYPDRTVWYGLPEPLLDPVSGFFFAGGLVVVAAGLWRGRVWAAKAMPMWAWWLLGTVLGGALTESPPSSMRLVGLSVPVCFLMAVALTWGLRHARRRWRGLPLRPAVAAGCVLFAAVSLHTYFVRYSPQRIYGGRHAELATMLAPEYRRLAATHRIYFVGPPEMYWNFATNPYLAPEAVGVDLVDPVTSEAPPAGIEPGRGALFVLLPSRVEELDALKRWFPGGVERAIHSKGSRGLLGVVYESQVRPGD